MATPKGTRSYRLPVNDTDSVHIYSNAEAIWIQLRRMVPTESDIGHPSFKTALRITPEIARHLGDELARVSAKPGPRTKKAKKKTAAPLAPEPEGALCPHCDENPLIEHFGRGWCPICGMFDRPKTPTDPSASSSARTPRRKPVVHDFIDGWPEDDTPPAPK